ncbi:MAG TPA: tripartite tricarboxylate transporter substrate-binding protein [Ramlibacter sp.]|nr:tripartite tricarboxylate transporter substrate-binding protein [Ramlibacter sp.]
MALHRRAFTAAACSLLAAPWHSAAAQQVGRIIVGYPAGGTLDQTARRVADGWRRHGRNFVVDNRAGAAGRIANSQLKRERADGSALLCTHASAVTIYPHVYPKLMYDAVEDLVPVSPVVNVTCALAISSAVPASVRTVEDWRKWAAGDPTRAMYASPAAGSAAHFLGFMLGQSTQLKLQHVAYRGSAPAMQDLLGGQIAAYFGFVADFLPYLETGKLRILGTTGDKRSRFMPSVPTFPEQGLQQVRGAESYGLFAPPGTPRDVLGKLHAELQALAREPAFTSAFEQVGLEVQTLAPADYARQLQQEREAWKPVVAASGFRFEE